MKLRSVAAHFDPRSNATKLSTLLELSHCKLKISNALIGYGDLLLFLQAMPPDRKVLISARKEMARVAQLLAGSAGRPHPDLTNSGLPYTIYLSKFSHDLTRWLYLEGNCRIALDGFHGAALDLNQVLSVTLPTLEYSETTSGLENEELLQELGIQINDAVPFLLNELQKLDDQPLIKDLLFDGSGIYIRYRSRNRSFSRLYNKIPVNRPFFHGGLLKEFDQRELLDRSLPDALDLSPITKGLFIRAIKMSMVLTDRETDPVTHMDVNTMKVFDLERGITVAIYGIVASRQLALESYMGYTLFKNGYPAAYGGAWVFGGRAHFGINIFEAFRGAESGYMMCQLLRVFRQVFKVERFEIEPYQFGLDNPDGIATGAFWFFHKHGFRPVDKDLYELAEKEVARRNERKGHRTSKRTLTRFTEGNMVLSLGKCHRMGVYEIVDQVKRSIGDTYKGDRVLAEMESVKKFVKRTGQDPSVGRDEMRVLREVALWAEACHVTDPGKLELMVRMIELKPKDPYRYQELLLQYFTRK